MLRFSFISFLFLILSQPSMALIELKAGYGILASKPDLAGFYSGSSSDLPSAATRLFLVSAIK